MLEHLIEFEPEVIDHSGKTTPFEKEHPADVIDAKVNTVEWLKGLGAADTDTVVNQAEVQAARASFTNLISFRASRNHARTSHPDQNACCGATFGGHADCLRLGVCTAGQRTARLHRGQTVGRMRKPQRQHPLESAWACLAKVTEVGLFTDKIEVKKTDLTDEEIDKKLKDKLAKFMNVTDAEPIEDIEVSTPSPKEPDES
jgi:hypothetical protein